MSVVKRAAWVVLVLASACASQPEVRQESELVVRVRVRDDLAPLEATEEEVGDPICDPEGPDGLVVTAISAGMRHVCVAMSDGQVRCWGGGWAYQLGNGGAANQATPVRVRDVEGVTAIAAGRAHACALVQGGRAACWGSNDWGALGLGNRSNPPGNVAAEVPRLRGLSQLAVGSDHSCAMTERGQVHCWGRNQSGQLGDGSREVRTSPVPVRSLHAQHLAAGLDSTCAVAMDGGVRCWGGIVGTERPLNVDGLPVPAVSVAVGDATACARLADGTVWCWGDGTHGLLGPRVRTSSDAPVQVVGLPPVESLSLGGARACATDAEGHAWCWGASDALGEDSAEPRVLANVGPIVGTALGSEAECARMASGGVCCWGSNASGVIGTVIHPFSSPAEIAQLPAPLAW